MRRRPRVIMISIIHFTSHLVIFSIFFIIHLFSSWHPHNHNRPDQCQQFKNLNDFVDDNQPWMRKLFFLVTTEIADVVVILAQQCHSACNKWIEHEIYGKNKSSSSNEICNCLNTRSFCSGRVEQTGEIIKRYWNTLHQSIKYKYQNRDEDVVLHFNLLSIFMSCWLPLTIDSSPRASSAAAEPNNRIRNSRACLMMMEKKERNMLQ